MSKGSMYLRYSDQFWDSPENPEGGGTALPEVEGLPQPAVADSIFPELPELPSIDLHGVKIHAVSEAAAVQRVLDCLDRGHGGVVVTPNLDHLRRCCRDVHFEALVAEADLVTADGMPLVWASRLQGTPLPERVAGSNLISTLSAGAALRGRSVFLLGGAPGTAEGAAKVLLERYPGLTIAGTACPTLGKKLEKRDLGGLCNILEAARPDIVFVAMGSPKQELLISHLRTVLPRGWWLGVGNSFSFLCGHVRRAPLWMQRFGLEWIHRLGQEPKRLFKRYVLVGVPFGIRLMYRAAHRRIIRILTGQPTGIPAAPYIAATPVQPVEVRSALQAASAEESLHVGLARPLDNELHLVGQSLLQGHDWAQPMPESTDCAPAADSGASAQAVEPRPGNRLAKLKALILMGGAVRPTEPAKESGRSLLDLPLDENGSLLNYWLSQAADVARIAGMPSLPMRIMVNRTSAEPFSGHAQYNGCYVVERDRSDFRGTGGVLRDLAERYEDDDVILVANAAQILLDPLSSLAIALDRKGSDLAVISHDDGTPSGVMLIACKALRSIPDMGYHDMKEQALPLIAKSFNVRVVRRRRPTGIPIRTLEDYILGLRFHHSRLAHKPAFADPMAEDWSSTFQVTEPGATVEPHSRLHDSVVLAGGLVQSGAIVVRSVICAGGIVRGDQVVVDQFVTKQANSEDEITDKGSMPPDGGGSGHVPVGPGANSQPARYSSPVPMVAPAAMSAMPPGGMNSMLR